MPNEDSSVLCKICHKPLVEDDDELKFQCNCYDGNRFKFTLQWCDECKEMTARRGTSKSSKCYKCAVRLQHKVMKEKDPEGYAQRQSNASKKAHESMKANNSGIYSQKVRDAIEKTKHENGFYGRLQEASKQWKAENPERVKEIAKIGAQGLAKVIREMSDEERMEWVGRSCNNEEANRKKSIAKSKNSGLRYCKKCDCETFHLNGMCIKCHPSAGTGRTYELPLVFAKSFITQDGVLCYYDRSNNVYVPWDGYKQKFYRKRLGNDGLDSFVQYVRSMDCFQPKHMGPAGSYDLNDVVQLVTTFREQGSELWAGARKAFEQRLVELGIEWFAYIKFYLDHNLITGECQNTSSGGWQERQPAG